MSMTYLGEIVDDKLVDAFFDVAEVVVLGDGVEHNGVVNIDVAEIVDTHADDDADAQLVSTLENWSDCFAGDLHLSRVDKRQHGADHLHRKLTQVDRYHFTCQSNDRSINQSINRWKIRHGVANEIEENQRKRGAMGYKKSAIMMNTNIPRPSLV